MARLFKKPEIAENRIENSGRWPVRVTRFQLVDEYQFPATNFPEVFYVEEGRCLHETEAGVQALRSGAALMVNPGHSHTILKPEEVVLTRVRYLPEWLTREYEIIIRSPDLLGLFFDQSWFHYPREERLHIFATSGKGSERIREELSYLRELLRKERQYEPVTRVSVLKLMMLLADEYRRFWRGVPEIELMPEALHALDWVERCILRGERDAIARMPRSGYAKRSIEQAFGELTGLSIEAYALRRRVFHAAYLLLTTRQELRQIAQALGWNKVGECAADFESVFDLPPAVYREKFGPHAEC